MPTWVTPTTSRASGFVPTSTHYNQLVNNLKFLQYQGAKGQTLVLHNTTGSGEDPVTIGSGVWTKLPVHAIADATWRTSTAMIDATTSSAGGVFTIPVGMTGVWNFDYWCAFEAWTPGFVNSHWYGNQLVKSGAGATTMWLKWTHPYVYGTQPLINSGSWMFYCTSGETVQLKARQDSGSNKYAVGWLHGQWLSGGGGTRPSFSKVDVPDPRSIVTNTIWNQIQGNLKFLHDPPWCWVALDLPQSHTSSTAEVIGFDLADIYDASGMHSPVTNNTRVTVPYGGVYLCNLAVGYDADADFDGDHSLFVERWTDRGDGTFVLCGDTRYSVWQVAMGSGNPLSALYGYTISGTALIHCRAGDYLRFYTYQDSGTTLTLSAAEAQVMYLGQLRNVAYGDNLNAPAEAGYVS